MPRIDRNRSLPMPYRPNPPPVPSSAIEEILRATWAELERIATSFSDLDRPLSFSATGADSIAVGATATYNVMLNDSPTVIWEQPGGTFNPATGVWTCSTEGLYTINASVVSVPFVAPATKSYSVLARITRTPGVGAPVVYNFAGGGLDDQNVTAVGTVLVPMQQGDTLQLTAAGVHPTKVGTNNVTCYLNVTRESGTGNAD